MMRPPFCILKQFQETCCSGSLSSFQVLKAEYDQSITHKSFYNIYQILSGFQSCCCCLKVSDAMQFEADYNTEKCEVFVKKVINVSLLHLDDCSY